ncbi:MAG TPA: NAD-dependent epimerase/dehydratase family protein [Thermoanaerobaculia bacterium]|jgi:UDP-glucuronate 4-epimerase|nr:NAD-dependent epimerase/dehydratase family protein [Thermoanaerobaculia bacterium]
MPSHVLVTGGAGFIGSHLTRRLLARGDRVTVLDDFNDFYDPARKRRNVAQLLAEPDAIAATPAGTAGAATGADPGHRDRLQLVEGDIRDAALVDRLFAAGGFDAVVHLAARAGVRPSLREPVLYEDVNCIGTLRLLEAARRHGPRLFVFGSSSSVYGINTKVPFSEDDEVNQPISPYATTKRSGELLCYNYHHLYGFRIACLRFFTVYGPAQRPEMAIHKFTELLARGEPVPMFGDGSSRRDYTYVDDIVDGIGATLALAPGFEILNLGGADTTSLMDLVLGLAAELAVEPRIEYLAAQPGDVPITYADVSRAARLLGYSPKVPIREGLRRFVRWFREQQPAPAPVPAQTSDGSGMKRIDPLRELPRL